MTFEDYIEDLCRRHPAIRHEACGYCHFSCLADDSQTKFARSMHYPCVVLDTEDFTISGQTGNELITTDSSIMFLQHVRDTGKSQEVRAAFSSMREVALDFLKKMSRDKRNGSRVLARFSPIGTEGHRVYFKDSGLYGYIIFLNNDERFTDLDCDNVFDS